MKKSLLLLPLLLVSSWHSLADTITVKGSDTLLILAQKWAEVYMQAHPGTKIQVSGGGSGIGFAALQDQTTDLCDASRKAKAVEIENCIKAFNARPTEYKVALDGLSVYVNNDNPVNSLTVAQLTDIFTGKITNWKEVGGPNQTITLYSRENSSGSYEFFKENILKGHDFSDKAQTMPGTAALLQAVNKDKGGIGYGGVAYGVGTKHLAIKHDEFSPAIDPTQENILKGKYPLWRYLYVYVNPARDHGEIGSYLNWIRSNEGQEKVSQVGYFPLPPNLRSESDL
jgi:phosphate transport system substrate-binding protein